MNSDEFGSRDSDGLQPGERLFIGTGNFRQMAMIDYSVDEARYIVSYREAGEVLTTNVTEGGFPDLLVFPILFAYRHWLELQLKSLIKLGQRWDGEPVEPRHTHKLELLWPLARTAIEKAFPDGESAELDTIASIIDELVVVDPESMSFRYSRDRRGQLNLPHGLERVNLAHIAKVMCELELVLGGAAEGMYDMIDNAEDFGP